MAEEDHTNTYKNTRLKEKKDKGADDAFFW